MSHIAVDWHASYKCLPADKAEQPLKIGFIVRRHDDLRQQPRVPMDLYLVVDSSASMDKPSKDGLTRLARVTQTASALVDRLAEGDGIAVLCFGLKEFIDRRTKQAEAKIALAEAQASAEVRAVAEHAARAAEIVLTDQMKGPGGADLVTHEIGEIRRRLS